MRFWSQAIMAFPATTRFLEALKFPMSNLKVLNRPIWANFGTCVHEALPWRSLSVRFAHSRRHIVANHCQDLYGHEFFYYASYHHNVANMGFYCRSRTGIYRNYNA